MLPVDSTLRHSIDITATGDSGLAHESVRSPRAIWISIVALAIIYVALFVSGVRFFVFKTAVVPVILAYALLVRQRVAFVTDWLPLLSATVLFDAVRGAIWLVVQRGYQVYYVQYVIDLERAIFGVPAVSIPFQTTRTPTLDVIAVLIHSTHFMYFLFFGLVLWHARREHFRPFRRALVLVMMFGLVGYAVIPTAPPWIAALPYYHALPPVPHIAESVYTHYVQELYGAFATNPMAAMPSLHVAFPVMCALVGWRAYGPRIGVALSLYALAVSLAAIYLGEHYAVDAVGGGLLAWLATAVARRLTSLDLSFRATLIVSAAGIACTAVLVQLARAIPERLF